VCIGPVRVLLPSYVGVSWFVWPLRQLAIDLVHLLLQWRLTWPQYMSASRSSASWQFSAAGVIKIQALTCVGRDDMPLHTVNRRHPTSVSLNTFLRLFSCLLDAHGTVSSHLWGRRVRHWCVWLRKYRGLFVTYTYKSRSDWSGKTGIFWVNLAPFARSEYKDDCDTFIGPLQSRFRTGPPAHYHERCHVDDEL